MAVLVKLSVLSLVFFFISDLLIKHMHNKSLYCACWLLLCKKRLLLFYETNSKKGRSLAQCMWSECLLWSIESLFVELWVVEAKLVLPPSVSAAVLQDETPERKSDTKAEILKNFYLDWFIQIQKELCFPSMLEEKPGTITVLQPEL